MMFREIMYCILEVFIYRQLQLGSQWILEYRILIYI